MIEHKETGVYFIRCIDNLGRVCIPKELRKILDIKPNAPIVLSLCENTIILKKKQKNINYENLLKDLLSEKRSDYKDFLITNKEVLIFQELINSYLIKLIQEKDDNNYSR